MKIKINARKTINYLIETALIIVLLISFNSVYLREWDGVQLLNTTKVWLVTMMFLGLYCVANIDCIFRLLKKLRVLQTFALYYALYFLVLLFVDKYETSATTYFRFYGLFLPAALLFLFVKGEEKTETLRHISGVIYVLMIISSAIWLLGPVLGVIPKTKEMLVYWGQYRQYESYLGLLFTYYRGTMHVFGREVLKNISIFTESPMSGMIFTLGFVLYLTQSKTKNKYKVYTFLFCILTTGSTTSFILAVLLFVYDSYRDIIIMQFKRLRVRYAAWIIGGSAMLLLGTMFVAQVLQQKSLTEASSFNDHFSDFFDGLALIGEHFFTGVGMGSPLNYVNYTSGFIRVLTEGGVLFLSIYFVSFLAMVKSTKYLDDKKFLLFIGILFAQFVLVICQDTLFFLFFIAYGYSTLFEHQTKKRKSQAYHKVSRT